MSHYAVKVVFAHILKIIALTTYVLGYQGLKTQNNQEDLDLSGL